MKLFQIFLELFEKFFKNIGETFLLLPFQLSLERNKLPIYIKNPTIDDVINLKWLYCILVQGCY